MSHRSKWSLIGVPDHQGVLNVGGRIGAAAGPAAFRRVFSRFRGRAPVIQALASDQDYGPVSSDLERTHREAAEWIARAHAATGLSVVVGGGHDLAFPQLQGIRTASGNCRIGCINIDAHLDVRKPEPLITSGSPFYLAIEAGVLDPAHLIEFGIQSHCNSGDLWNYVERKKVPVIPFQNLRGGEGPRAFEKAFKQLSAKVDAIVVNLDLDAAAAAFAPGVSAPQAEGFTSSELITMMEFAGAQKKCVSLGIFELNPVHDEGDKTARLAATVAYHFVASAISR